MEALDEPLRVTVTPGTGFWVGFEQLRMVPDILTSGPGVGDGVGEPTGVGVGVSPGVGVGVSRGVGVGVGTGVAVGEGVGEGVGAAITVRLAVSVAVEKAVPSPFTEVFVTPPLLPIVWSQARKVMALTSVPLKPALGRK